MRSNHPQQISIPDVLAPVAFAPAGWMIVLAWMMVIEAFAATPLTRQQFDVPAGNAEEMLPVFVAQRFLDHRAATPQCFVPCLNPNPCPGGNRLGQSVALLR